MAREAYKYLLFNLNKLPLYKDKNSGFILVGNEDYLRPDGELAALEFSPLGWADTLVKYGRNIKYWGLVRDMTVPMRFPKDGWDIIDNVFWVHGYEGLLYLGILKLDRSGLPYKYQNWYFSEINLVKYKKSDTDVSVEALEGGMSKIFKAYEDTDFEIDIDSDPEIKHGQLDGMFLIGSQTWLMGVQEWKAADLLEFAPTFPELANEGVSTGMAFFDTLLTEIFPLATYLNTSTNYFAINTSDDVLDLRLQGSFPLKLTQQRDSRYISIRLYVWNPAVGIGSQQIFYIFDQAVNGDLPLVQGETRQVTFDRTITLNPGDQVFWVINISLGTGTGQQSDWSIPTDGEYRAEYRNKFRTTYYSGLYPWTLFRRLVEKATEGQNIFSLDNVFCKSSFLENKKDIIITSQDAIRGIAGSKIVTSLSKFFKSMNHWCTSLGIEDNKLFLELYGYVFKQTEFIDLGEVSEAIDDVAEDLLFNTIKTGGPEVDYNDINGKFEVNQEQVWKTTVTKVAVELDLTTPYRRDPIGIEFARINFEGKTTTDNESDNDVFMINVESNETIGADGIPYFKLFRPAYTLIEGVGDPVGIFNVELSPKRTILNNLVRINGALDLQMYGKLITLASKVKNASLNTEGYSNVDEDAPIEVGTGSQLWRPHYLSFKTKLSKNVLPIIDAHQYEKIRFKVKGRTYFSFLFDGGVKPELNDVQGWKTLSSVENDLFKFNK